MNDIFLFLMVLMGILAVLDLIVGVSNDAVNFLGSAVGSRAASFKFIIVVASVGIILGAVFSNGMMEIARRGIFHPEMFVFEEVIMIYLAVMITDVILLDVFNTLGLQAAKRAGLLHDIGKALDHEFEGTHVALGVEYARKYREKEDIIHAIQAHHGDVECRTLVACLVQAADAISAARPGARRENLENYIKRLEKLEEITGSYPGVEKSYAIQAGREVRVMVKPEQVSEDEMVILARELAKRIESELEYPGQIKVHVLRETKVVEYAK